MTRLFLVCAALFAASACGLKRVPNDVLVKLPYEARIELLEAENDLAVAVDRVDEAHNDFLRIREHLRRADSRRSAARDERSNASDAASKTVADLAVTEAEARLEWLRTRRDIAQAEERAADVALTCAKARFEQQRLAVARKAKLEGSEKLDPKDFEDQTKRCDDAFAQEKARVKGLATEGEKVRAAWETAKHALAQKTFDARASPYVE